MGKTKSGSATSGSYGSGSVTGRNGSNASPNSNAGGSANGG
jgi:hypothetical protein